MYFILFWLYHLNNFPKLDIIIRNISMEGRDRQIRRRKKETESGERIDYTYMHMYLNKRRDRQKEREWWVKLSILITGEIDR